ncbi:MAG: hypothetical protein K8T25_21150 [Planctomycetia bacterium]|nr:hypothetical protein [Planctomycetia bacterium]
MKKLGINAAVLWMLLTAVVAGHAAPPATAPAASAPNVAAPKASDRAKPAPPSPAKANSAEYAASAKPAATVPSTVAQQPEELLADNTLFYFRFDGFIGHLPSYAKTDFASLVHDELRPLFGQVGRSIIHQIENGSLVEKLQQGASPEALLQLADTGQRIVRVLKAVGLHGIVAAMDIEDADADKSKFRFTLIMPDAVTHHVDDDIAGLFQAGAVVDNRKIRTAEFAGRHVRWYRDHDKQTVCTWIEGTHSVLLISKGYDKPYEEVIVRVSGVRGQKNLQSSKSFTELANFNRYDCYARGFVASPQILKMMTKESPEAAELLAQLGLEGIGAARFYLGFEGAYQRSTVEVQLPAEREGLLKLLNGYAAVSTEGLPPLSPDSNYVAASGLDAAAAYDTVIKLAATLAKKSAPDFVQQLEHSVADGGKSRLGVDFRKEILSALSPRVIVTTAPTEGLSVLGAQLMFQVKDEARLRKAFDTLMISAASIGSRQFSLRKKTYHGAELYVFEGTGEGLYFAPTATIHQGWLVIGLFPQPVQGYVRRVEPGNQLAVWQPSPLLREVMQSFSPAAGGDAKKAGGPKVIGFTELNPKFGAKILMSLAPIGAAAIRNAAGQQLDFDLTQVPPAQVITSRLKPSVEVVVDDGTSVRLETYAQVPLITPVITMPLLLYYPGALGASALIPFF